MRGSAPGVSGYPKNDSGTDTIARQVPEHLPSRGHLVKVGFAQRVSNDVNSLGGFGRAWVVGNLAFSAGRALIAWPTLGEYGVNPIAFLILDLVTAPPYGLAQAMTVKILRDKDRNRSDAVGWGVLVVALFIAPYIYIFAASGNMPFLAYAGVIAWMAIFGIMSIMRMRRDISAGTPEGPGLAPGAS